MHNGDRDDNVRTKMNCKLEEGGNTADMEVIRSKLDDRVFALLVPADLEVDLVLGTESNGEERSSPSPRPSNHYDRHP